MIPEITPSDPRIAYDGVGPRDPDRIEPVLEMLRAAWERNPDRRLGQLLSNAAHHIVRPGAQITEQTFWNAEEDEWVDGLRQVLGFPSSRKEHS